MATDRGAEAPFTVLTLATLMGYAQAGLAKAPQIHGDERKPHPGTLGYPLLSKALTEDVK